MWYPSTEECSRACADGDRAGDMERSFGNNNSRSEMESSGRCSSSENATPLGGRSQNCRAPRVRSRGSRPSNVDGRATRGRHEDIDADSDAERIAEAAAAAGGARFRPSDGEQSIRRNLTGATETAAGSAAGGGRGGGHYGSDSTVSRAAVRSRNNTNGIAYSTVERVELCAAWLEVSENSVVGTDQRGKEFFAAVTKIFQARMDRKTSQAETNGIVARVVREAGAVQRYFQNLNEKVMRLVCARVHVESLELTGNPSEADMELVMMAWFEKRDVYEAIRLGRYVPNPLLKSQESKAAYWLDCWRVLKVSDKYSGAAAMAAQAAARRRARPAEPPGGATVASGDACAEDAATDSVGEEHMNRLASGKRQRPASFAERPLGTQSTLERMAHAALDKAFAAEGAANTKALKVFARAVDDRTLVATLSAPAIRDEPRFRASLAKRADELISAHMAAQTSTATLQETNGNNPVWRAASRATSVGQEATARDGSGNEAEVQEDAEELRLEENPVTRQVCRRSGLSGVPMSAGTCADAGVPSLWQDGSRASAQRAQEGGVKHLPVTAVSHDDK